MAQVSSERDIRHIKGSGESEVSDCKETSIGVQTFTTRDDSESLIVRKAGFEATSALLKVKEMEIMSTICSGRLINTLLILSAFICGFGYYLDFVTRSVYTGYATESFNEHSLLSTVQVVNSVVSIAAQIIFARLSDVYGRLQLFLVGTFLYTIGTIIQSQANGLGTYSIGAILYNSGFVGVSLLLVLVLSDMSPTAWRLFYQFAPSWPCIIISWVSGDIVEAANPAKNWRLDIGIWAAIFPLSALPFVGFILYIIHQASKTVEWKELQQEKSFNTVGFLSYTRALGNGLDAFGIVLITASLGCVLVPLTLAGGASEDWKKPGVIATLVVGVILFMGFLIWEIKCPGNPVLPFSLLRDRGVWATLLSTFLEKMIYAMINDYLYPVLLVSVNESSKSATRIIWLPTFVACVGSFFFGLLVTRIKRLKPFSIFGICLWIVAIGLFYNFRGGASSHAGIVSASVVLGLGATIFTQSFIVNLQTMTSHNNMASITGLYFMFVQVGNAAGASVSGAIWTQTMYKQLFRRLKNENLAKAAFSSPYEFIASYPWGTPERTQVISAYRHVQKQTMLVSLILTGILLLSSLFTKDRKLCDTIGEEEAAQSDEDPMFTWALRIFRRFSFKK